MTPLTAFRRPGARSVNRSTCSAGRSSSRFGNASYPSIGDYGWPAHGGHPDHWDGAVLTITLNRPDVLNALNASMHAALHEALRGAEDPTVRAVVITGAGRGFQVGQTCRSSARRR
jgi:hypothetical protein